MCLACSHFVVSMISCDSSNWAKQRCFEIAVAEICYSKCSSKVDYFKTRMRLMWNAAVHSVVWGRRNELVMLCFQVHDDIITGKTLEDWDKNIIMAVCWCMEIFLSPLLKFVELFSRTWSLLFRIKLKRSCILTSYITRPKKTLMDPSGIPSGMIVIWKINCSFCVFFYFHALRLTNSSSDFIASRYDLINLIHVMLSSRNFNSENSN